MTQSLKNETLQIRKKKQKRLIDFDYFRAFGILFIICGHCPNKWDREGYAEIVFSNVIDGNTALFVFISGFFFHRIFYNDFDLSNFLMKKTMGVFIPYIILTTSFIMICYILFGGVNFPFRIHSDDDLNNVISAVANFITGKTLTAYWYIPFIMIIFIISPVFVLFIKIQKKTQILIMIFLFIVSMYVHRPVLNINPLHSVLYFLPYYLIGIFYSQNKITIDDMIKGNLFNFFLLVITVSTVMFYVDQIGNSHKVFPWIWNGLDLMVLQKISLIFFMLCLCKTLEKNNIALLTYFAQRSFALFFIHPWVIFAAKILFLNQYLQGAIGSLMLFPLVLLVSVLLAETVKLVFKERSRFLIGW
ncbi:MAG: acyltransferase family protein [Geminicoccaceae bacterium]